MLDTNIVDTKSKYFDIETNKSWSYLMTNLS